MQLGPFHLGEIFSGWAHMLRGLKRSLFNRPVDYFLNQAAQNGMQCRLLVLPDGQAQTCPICGYAMAVLEPAKGWILQTCSASGLSRLGQRDFLSWAGKIPQCKPVERLHCAGELPADPCLPGSNV